MEKVLHLLQAVAPLLFVTVALVLIVVKIISFIINIQLKRIVHTQEKLMDESEQLGLDVSDFKCKLDALDEPLDKVCTKDDPEIGCIKIKIEKFESQSAELLKSANRIDKIVKLIHLILLSPLGKLLLFVGNIDVPERRQS